MDQEGYVVKLTWPMLVALVDIDSGYMKEDSPRHDARTMNALKRRKFIGIADRLTKKGRAYTYAALEETYGKLHGREKKLKAAQA